MGVQQAVLGREAVNVQVHVVGLALAKLIADAERQHVGDPAVPAPSRPVT